MEHADDTERRIRAVNDPVRLAALRATDLIDTDVEEVFDRLTRLAVRLLDIPAAFISLVDENRDFYKSACGFGEPLATSRELTGLTFCHYTVQRTAPLVIPDTAADPLYQSVPTVQSLGVAAYVGVPLVIDGQTIGAFCSIDVKPRDWTTDEIEVLTELAASAQREIELRGAIRAANRAIDVAEDRRLDVERSNEQLHEQAVELELHAEELRATTLHLEERTEAAEYANRAKVGFLSMMSHELRTPLNAIGGYSELMELEVCGPITEQQRDYLSRIKRAGKHLETLIGDILDFTHLDAGKVQFEIEDVPVDMAIREAAELLAPQISECGIEFVHTRCPDLAGGRKRVVRADPKKLRQILVNLLTNAIKFTPASGRVSVASTVVGDRVFMKVADTGRGISPGQLQQIFEPFVQIDRASVPTKIQGVGLGLSICKHLAAGMHGDISVESEPGLGSTFTIELPLAT